MQVEDTYDTSPYRFGEDLRRISIREHISNMTKLVNFLIPFMALFNVDGVEKASHDEPFNWAEKLGFPAGKRVIILHADDAWMCDEANAAKAYYLENDQIQSVAAMIPSPAHRMNSSDGPWIILTRISACTSHIPVNGRLIAGDP